MGNFLSEPQPIQISLKYTKPRLKTVPGFTQENDYTLQYTLIDGYNTVSHLLSMTQQHGVPDGNGIIGFTRQPNETSSQMLGLDDQLQDNETLYIMVV